MTALNDLFAGVKQHHGCQISGLFFDDGCVVFSSKAVSCFPFLCAVHSTESVVFVVLLIFNMRRISVAVVHDRPL